jgi:hypothetical protein
MGLTFITGNPAKAKLLSRLLDGERRVIALVTQAAGLPS